MDTWNRRAIRLCTFATHLLLAMCAGTGVCRAQTYEILHSFTGNDGHGFNGDTDGANPAAALVQAPDGFFYGTTVGGSASATGPTGTVFRMSQTGQVTILRHFLQVQTGDGANPSSALVLGPDGHLYGTTPVSLGNSAGQGGTVFRISTAGAFTKLHTFLGPEGGGPYDSVVFGADGHLYGTTTRGGAPNRGTVYRMTTGGVPTLLHTLLDVGSYDWYKSALVQGTDGHFYGTTRGGGTSGLGTIFRVTGGGAFTVIHSFTGTAGIDGAAPLAALIRGTDGAFYGTTFDGGVFGYGTVFKVTTAGTVTLLHSFTHASGAHPRARLLQASDGNFYGTTYAGGAFDYGTIFRMTPAGVLTTLRSFAPRPAFQPTSDGVRPHAGLIEGTDGHLYGTTYGGGSQNKGVVFRMRLSTSAPPSPTDLDGDGLPNAWETQFGLDSAAASGMHGAAGDPDDDGRSNLQEYQDGTHPRGFVITYLAEGATGAFFQTRLALANPTAGPALVLVRYQTGTGAVVPQFLTVAPFSRATIDVGSLAGLGAAEFSILVESDAQVIADRTMSWDDRGFGAHAERGIVAQTSTTWYFAEGATHSGFDLFYLLQNPGTQSATVEVTYLRPAPAPPLVKTYTLGPQSRTNIWVDNEAGVDPALAALAAADVSAVIRSTNGVPIVAERAMYLAAGGLPLGAGHESAGVTALSTTWFFAEGATGPYFDLFYLLGNPGSQDAIVEARYLLPDGQVLVRDYVVPALSRFNIWVDFEDARLADTAVSATLTSRNGVPIVAERSMWWPGQPIAPAWTEAHNSPGATQTGIAWAMADGESGGPRDVDTYVLIANTSPQAGTARVTLLFEDATTAVQEHPLLPNSRFNVAVREFFPESAGRRYGVLVESVGSTPVQVVVERAMYWDALGEKWAAGTNALATRLR